MSPQLKKTYDAIAAKYGFQWLDMDQLDREFNSHHLLDLLQIGMATCKTLPRQLGVPHPVTRYRIFA